MTVCLNNPVLGREITDNFTFDDANNQIVPKPGTDTKPGALALNLGNATVDATNATDALTAAGFNAMANAVDSTAPLCGNEIQQAVTAAVAQSIACDADAQEAIACAIASNPDAVACLQAVLCGSTTSGKYYVATTRNMDPGGATARQGNCYMVNNGVVTLLSPSAFTTYWDLQDVNRDKPVAYYRNSSAAINVVLSQITMSDAGITETLYDMSNIATFPPQVTQNFTRSIYRVYYDTVTQSLYSSFSFSGNDDDGAAYSNRGMVKFTLDANGLITGSSQVPQATNLNVDYVAHGVALLNGASKSLNLSTGVVSTIATGSYGYDFSILDISPDGSKWAHTTGEDGTAVVAHVRSTTTGAIITKIYSDGYMALYLNGGGFFSRDSDKLIVNGGRARGGGAGNITTGTGFWVYDANTGARIMNSIYMTSDHTSSGAGMAGTGISQNYASNNAILTVSDANGAPVSGNARILEAGDDDIWREVALISTVQKAGFYLVSA